MAKVHDSRSEHRSLRNKRNRIAFFPLRFLAVLVSVPAILLGTHSETFAQNAAVHIVLEKAGIMLRAHGSGTLFYKNRRWRLDIGGINFDAIGAPRAVFHGKVANLHDVKDIIGTYHPADSVTPIVSHDNVRQLKNADGVTLDLQGLKPGLSMNFDGMTITGRGWTSRRY
jgi:hypothetical protein